MCDTLLALANATASKAVLFGKNSDRQRNEAHLVELLPAKDYSNTDQVRCTYISIPQVARTHAALICRPFWIWGAEMGANVHGVVIGNEGLYARIPAPQSAALIGMDFIRLALERAASASEACEVITDLLARHGQGGNCGHLTESYYHNSFLIADPTEAFVLETVDRDWTIERARTVRAISNAYTIAHPDTTSAGFGALTQSLGGAAGDDVSVLLADPTTSHIGSGPARQQRATALLNAKSGTLAIRDIFGALRDHDPLGEDDFSWDSDGTCRRSLCVHAGSDRRGGQTTGALASELSKRGHVHWVTGTAAPCISIFKPVLLNAALPPHGPAPTDRFESASLWWRHEEMHRTALAHGLPEFIATIRSERDALEEEFNERVTQVLDAEAAVRDRAIASCWRDAAAAEFRWRAALPSVRAFSDTPFGRSWSRFDRIAGIAN